MKIALIGNMNNNNFALMRYFRDLGADAHLLLNKDDGQGTLAHFKPENDTWEIDKWKPYIHQTELVNNPIMLLGHHWFYKEILMIKNFIAYFFGKSFYYLKTPSKQYIYKLINQYDVFVGSGITPALFNELGLKLDLFYPYAIGVEYLENGVFIKKKGLIHSKYKKKIIEMQTSGLRETKHCLTAEIGWSQNALEGIGIKPYPLAVPMVYNPELAMDHILLPNRLLKIKKEMCSHSFVILSHSRLIWRKPPALTESQWRFENKNSDWLIRGYAELIKLKPKLDCNLFLFEYGSDIKATKELCDELEIQHRVTWLPLMPRKEIMFCMNFCHIVVGEFYQDNVLWGGTGWEALAVGKPLLQGFKFVHNEFESVYHYPEPPILKVVEKDDILRHLITGSEDIKSLHKIGETAKQWFDMHNGINMARRWLNLLTKNNY
jgi:hypothetical protein